jgi:peroxiredoxin (alkyl hydroperoxide reductase subunit C)
MSEIGTTAPAFSLDGNDFQKHSLTDYKGKKVLLVFYPLDFSPVCTNEMGCFMDDLSGFNDAGVQVLGISVDSKWAHKAFAESQNLRFPLLADFHPKGAVAQAYGVYNEVAGISNRAIILVDEDGKIARSWTYDIPQLPDVKAVLAGV